ncbi:hypothetical protein [Ralstonia pseudosolanacearum]|uniref:hypothetical protein n=1 Tax=Ralstonia pseudosolanacearum TaxID=1310165 RepID=UPI0007D77620|nr:hypothetical protein [Ralstonia pseudosolanacearum]OAI58611.1 hypothetical protein RSP781_24680 [Ralstonia pseudosolanacearum]
MTLEQFIGVLGLSKDSEGMAALMTAVGEAPVISRTPADFNDPAGETEYYKFINSGIEIGFRGGVLNHLHLYVQEHEGYGAYKGELFEMPLRDVSESDISRNLGEQSAQGGGRMDMLIGYIHKWIRYDRQGFALRAEFSEDKKLRKLSLIKI